MLLAARAQKVLPNLAAQRLAARSAVVRRARPAVHQVVPIVEVGLAAGWAVADAGPLHTHGAKLRKGRQPMEVEGSSGAGGLRGSAKAIEQLRV